MKIKTMQRRLAGLACSLLCLAALPQEGGQAEVAGDPGELIAEDGGRRGLVSRAAGALDGYTLVSPLRSATVHLVDLEGTSVHTWKSEYGPGGGCYLEDNGHLLRCARIDENPRFHGGGIGGLIEEFDWEGNLVWTYALGDEYQTQHHDMERLPNGNLLVIAWEYLAPDEVRAFGRDPEAIGGEGLWPDCVLEIRPTLPEGGEVVWEWHAWDHLIQDFDPSGPYYGSIPDAPGKIDINYDHRDQPPMTEEQKLAAAEQLEQMRALGYIGGEDDEDEGDDGPPSPRPDESMSPDWMHTNGVAYLPTYDLIALSSPRLCELFVIDHSTTTAEAATSSGGRFGRGGELLWRWGNPRNYGHGSDADKRLFYQHDPTWLETDAGLSLLVYNNGGRRPDGDYSTIEELVLPFDPEHGFTRAEGEAFGPAEPSWVHRAGDAYFSSFISGAQRLPNGNTLICAGAPGRVYEVTRDGTVVWDYLNPYGGDAPGTSQSGHAPTNALFRAYRFGVDHPAVSRLESE